MTKPLAKGLSQFNVNDNYRAMNDNGRMVVMTYLGNGYFTCKFRADIRKVTSPSQECAHISGFVPFYSKEDHMEETKP